MAPSTLERKDGAWLQGHAHEWVAAGLISPDQAESIRHFEHLDEPVAPQRLTIVAEVASYLGGVIAFAGGAAIIGPNWEQLGLAGQGAVALVIALIGFTVGTWLVRLGEAGATRLGTFLWLVGTGGVALAVAGIVNEIDPGEDSWFAIAIGTSVLAIGLGLWRNLDRPLQLLTAAGGLLAASGGVAALTDVSVWIAAPTLWVASVAFGAIAALEHVQPRLVALAIAAAGVMIGSMLFSNESEEFSAIVSMLSAAAIVAFALYDRSWPLLALGMLAFFVATTAMMEAVLHGVAARLVAVVVGLAVVAYVAVRAQRMSRAGPVS